MERSATVSVILFRVIAILQAICLIPILIRFLLLPPDFDAVGLWFFVIGVGLVSVPYALWHFARRPSRRVWAGLMIMLAVCAVGAPMVMARFDLEPVPMPVAGLIATVLALIASAWLLTRPALWRAKRGWGTGRLNIVLLVLLLLWIVLVAALLLVGLAIGFPPPLADHRDGLDINTVLIHGAILGPLGLLLVIFAVLFSLAGLWRDRPRIVMHIAQLLAALVLLAVLVAEALLISLLIVNPG